MPALLAEITASGAKGILANIPDLNTLPFFTTFPTQPVELDSLKADTLNNIMWNIPSVQPPLYPEVAPRVVIDSPLPFEHVRWLGARSSLVDVVHQCEAVSVITWWRNKKLTA